jgi:alkylhydroperoxidase/carboxymuconolactone decarboxylase family protein YurZ
MDDYIPSPMKDFDKRYPDVWQAFVRLGEACHERGGPLDERTRRLAKLGIAIAAQHEGAVHSAVRHAREGGVTADEMMHVAVLSITTIGWPRAYAAMTWIDDVLSA